MSGNIPRDTSRRREIKGRPDPPAPVEFLEAEPGVVLPLDLLDGLLEEVPDVLHVLLVHGHGEGADPHLALLLGHPASARLHHLGSTDDGRPRFSSRNLSRGEGREI